MEDTFWVAKTSNIYLGCLKFMIIFFLLGGGGGEQLMLGLSLRMKKR